MAEYGLSAEAAAMRDARAKGPLRFDADGRIARPAPAREARTDDAALVEEVARDIEDALVAYPMRAVVTDGVAQLVVDRGLSAYIARAVIPVVERAVAGRARREALEEAVADIESDWTWGPHSERDRRAIAKHLRNLAAQSAPATDDTEGAGRGR